MTRASFLLIALSSLALPSCKSVSLGGNGEDGGGGETGGMTPAGCDKKPSGLPRCANGEPTTTCVDGIWTVKCPDAPPAGGQGGGGTSGTGTCQPRTFDVDCYGGATTYTCVQRGGEWVWDYSCPDVPDGGPGQVDTPPSAQHPYVSTGASCMLYSTSGYRAFPEDPTIQHSNNGEAWPQCTPNCNILTQISGASPYGPPDQALPAGLCDDEGATCGMGANAWCPPCADVGGPYNGYTCVCRAHSWHCAVAPIKGMNMCGMPTCISPAAATKPNSDCLKTTWTDKQVCACGVCRDLCDADAQCPSGRCKLNQVCRFPDNCTDPDKCTAPCRGLCEPAPDGGVVDGPVQPVDAAPGCDPVKAAQALSAAGLTIVSTGQTLNENLPSSLSASANWGVKEIACREGGYDLSAVSGRTVCLASFATTNLCQSQPTDAWVVMSDGIVRCIYQAVRPDSPMSPGVYSVHDSVCSPADGGTACSGARIDNKQAASAFAEYMRITNPEVAPRGTYLAEEKTVANLWESLQAQLFFATWYDDDGTAGNTMAYLYRDCTITTLTNDRMFARIDSGIVANGMFYYSWGWGSGIYRSNLGKIAVNGTTLNKVISPSYFNPSSGPPGLVVTSENGRLVVYRAAIAGGKFNEWTNPERIGFLTPFGDTLVIVDDTGKELPTTLP